LLFGGDPVRADNARDGKVNPVNSRHLVPFETASTVSSSESKSQGDSETGVAATRVSGDGDSTQAQPSGAGDDSEPPQPTCLAGIVQQDVHGWDFHGPLGITGQHPPSTLFYQPIPDVATVLDSGSTVSVKLDWMNLIIRELDSGVLVDYDYEELRSTIDYRMRAGSGEFSASVPFYHRGSGILDGVIEGWHKAFGMNNGLRDAYPDNQFRYTIISRDGVVYNSPGSGSGIGDLSLSYKQSLWGDDCRPDSAAWRVGLKVPTGDSGRAYGSGNWDYSAGLLFQRQFGARLRAYANLDYVWTGEPDWQNVDKHNVLHTLWAAEYALTPRFSLVGQYHTATNPLRIGSFEADKDPRELSIGFHHRISDNTLWTGGFREDISPETAPDLVFLSHLRWSF
jgi:hypothetical protein